METVKFYSVLDMSNGNQLEVLMRRINEFTTMNNDYSINQILEFYNIVQFINAKVYLPTWSEEDLKKIHYIVPSLNKQVAIFMKSINENNFLSIYSEIDFNYIDDFWRLCSKYRVYENISDEIIKESLLQNHDLIHYFLSQKELVDYYDSSVRDAIMQNEQNAELLLNRYAIDHDNKDTMLFFPSCFSEADREELINRYIQWPDANLNYLRIIENTLSSSDLKLSNKTRLSAKKRVEVITKEFFEKNNGFQFGASVRFSKELNSDYMMEYDKGSVNCTYNEGWIKDNLDFPTLLNNFIYLFEYADMQMRIALTSKPSHLGIFERFITIRLKNAYTTGIAFEQMERLSNLQIIAYSRFLESYEIRLETVIEWFFQTYLRDEFNIQNFRIQMPTKEASYLEKCRTILPEIESVLKQYQLYIEDRIIDHELLQISSDHLFFRNIKTTLPKKYVYPFGDEYREITFYLFSDQSGLAYTILTKSKYSTLFSLLQNESIKLEDFQKYQQRRIDRMLEQGYIFLDEQSIIQFTEPKTVLLLKDLYENEVLCYWHYPEEYRKIIDSKILQGLMAVESSLFSKTEQAYLNYHLNKADFCNSLDLRNKYLHGTQQSDDTSEQEHEYNYYIFLRLLVLIVIKINDDLCLFEGIASEAI